MNYENISASIAILNGKLVVNAMKDGDKTVTDEGRQVMIIRNIAADAAVDFEKNFQKQFIPTKDTKYILPKE